MRNGGECRRWPRVWLFDQPQCQAAEPMRRAYVAQLERDARSVGADLRLERPKGADLALSELSFF